MKGCLRRGIAGKLARADPRWGLRVHARRDATGREHRISRSFTGTKRQAQSALSVLVADSERTASIPNSKILLGQYATRWIESRKASGKLAAKTQTDTFGSSETISCLSLASPHLIKYHQSISAMPSARGERGNAMIEKVTHHWGHFQSPRGITIGGRALVMRP